MPRLSRSPLAAAATAALVGSVVLGGGAAWAAWSVTGAGNGATTAGSLVTPVAAAATSPTAPTTDIQVTWTANGEPAGTTYVVTRDATTDLTCTSSPCTDGGLEPGSTHSYVVSARLGSAWRAPSSSVSATTQAVNATTYAVSVQSPATAGSPAQVTITAKRPNGTTDTGYAGSKSLSWSGAAVASSPTGGSASLPSPVTFVSGVAVVSGTFVTAGSGLGLTATSAAPGSLTGTTTVTVMAGAPSRLGFTSTSTNKSSTLNCLTGCSSTSLGGNGYLKTKVSLLDQYGNATTHNADVVVTLTAGGASPQPSPTSLTITAGASESTAWTTLSESGSWVSDSLTASSSSPALSSVTATISK